ncbi:LPXTG-motif cell wall anchor domain protein [Carnobacterium maltaromaticum]|uniref:WxL domain-containing protein n=1 Tax=Carnobacterium maltaromaticum TaxID=2751 RepID=UPI00191BA8CC|nr:WxL domain-containing protein [Carnobacterium maltaromaticum]CAD5901674.1 LPXTG-motif cell wall anchor domain protein [Carnobacterium maltaromaticum]
MKTIKHVLLWGFSLFCFFSFTVTSLANTATSQAGISFTEKEDVGVGNTSLPKNKDLPNTGGNRTSSKLPQTGEHKDGNLLIIGLIFLGAALSIKKIRTKLGGRRMKLKTMTMLGLMGTGMLVGTSIANAAEPQDEVKGSADGKGGTSHGYINLVPGDTDTGKTDPEEPTVPPGGTGNEGILTLDNIAPLLFSTHKLDGKEQTYTSVVENSNIQVTDKRGEEEGWHVQVSQTPFVDKVDKTKVLKGTRLTLPAGVVKSDVGNVSLAPTVSSVEVNGDLATLMSAAKGSGAGTWRTVFNKDEVKLTVAAGNKKGEYMSTVTWTLSDAPK